jgi:hypothetical protein
MANPPPPPPPPPRPPIIVGDWTDDRTPAEELFYPPVEDVVLQDCRSRQSARPSAATDRRIRGVANTVPITYGNRITEARAYLNQKGGTNEYADTILPFVNRTMIDVLVNIIEILHLLFISVISGLILAHKTFGQGESRPNSHLQTAKGNIAAQVIKVLSYGLNANFDCLNSAARSTNNLVTNRFVTYAVSFLYDRLRSPDYDTQFDRQKLMSSIWPNFCKAIKCRSHFGIWSSAYIDTIIGRRRTSRNDSKITKGIYKIVAIYCEKLWQGFPTHIDGKPHHMLNREYEGTIWMQLVGDALYVDKDDCESDDADDGGAGGGGGDGGGGGGGSGSQPEETDDGSV